MSTLAIPEAQPTTEPRTVVLPSTEGDDALHEMIELVRNRGWTQGRFENRLDGTRCTLGLLRGVR